MARKKTPAKTPGWERQPVDWFWTVFYKKPRGKKLTSINTWEKDLTKASQVGREVAREIGAKGAEYGVSKTYIRSWGPRPDSWQEPITKAEYDAAIARGPKTHTNLDLCDVEKQAAKYPDTDFRIPTIMQRMNLLPGVQVQLIFQGIGERLWVEVKTPKVANRYTGLLVSHPLAREFAHGDYVVFGPEHVAKILRLDHLDRM